MFLRNDEGAVGTLKVNGFCAGVLLSGLVVGLLKRERKRKETESWYVCQRNHFILSNIPC